MKKIAILSQPEYFKLHYLDFLNSTSFYVREFTFKFNQEIIDFESLIRFEPDYVICFRGEFIDDSVFTMVSGIKIALSSEPFPRYYKNQWDYTDDSLNRYFTFLNIVNKKFDYVLHYDDSSQKIFEMDGITMSGFFKFPISVKSIYPQKVPKKWDLCFIGRSSERRELFMGRLKHHKKLIHIAHGVEGVDLNYYLNHSSIGLNIHASNELSWEPRLQIMMSSGCMVLSETITPNDILIDGYHYVSYSNEEDLYEKTNYYLSHIEESNRICHNARELMLEKFNAEVFFNDLLLNLNKLAKFNFVSINGTLASKNFFKEEKVTSTNRFKRFLRIK